LLIDIKIKVFGWLPDERVALRPEKKQLIEISNSLHLGRPVVQFKMKKSMKKSLFVLAFCLFGLFVSAQTVNTPQTGVMSKHRTECRSDQKHNCRMAKKSKAWPKGKSGKACKPSKRMRRKCTNAKCNPSAMKGMRKQKNSNPGVPSKPVMKENQK
jgi:hypothetical protein